MFNTPPNDLSRLWEIAFNFVARSKIPLVEVLLEANEDEFQVVGAVAPPEEAEC